MRNVCILYGSQTGNAKAISTTIHEKLITPEYTHKVNAQLWCMKQYAQKHPTLDQLAKEDILVVVCSTTGNGDLPDNTITFLMKLRKKSTDFLANCDYTMLALGDTNYDNFCGAGKKVEKQIVGLSAKSFYRTGLADDATGLEEVVEPWREGLFTRLLSLPDERPPALPPPTPPAQDILSSSLPSSSPAPSSAPSSLLPSSSTSLPTVNGLSSSSSAAAAAVEPLSLSPSPSLPSLETMMADFRRLVGDMVNHPALQQQLKASLHNLLPQLNNNELGAPPPSSSSSSSSSSLSLEPAVIRNGLPVPSPTVGGGVAGVAGGGGGAGGVVITNHSTTAITMNGVATSTSIKEGVMAAPLPRRLPERRVSSNDNDREVEFGDIFSPSPTTSAYNNNYFLQRWQAYEIDRVWKGYIPEAPFMAVVTGARVLTSSSSTDRIVVEIELQLPPDTRESVVYVPGDAIGVHSPNNALVVEQLIKRLQLEPNRTFTIKGNGMAHIPVPCTVWHAFTYCCDITIPLRIAGLRMLGDHCGNPQDRARVAAICSNYEREMEGLGSPALFDLLQLLPSCKPPLGELLAHLPPLQPRYYSACTSHMQHPTVVRFAFSLVHFVTPPPSSRYREGVCTSWLVRVCQEAGFLPDPLILTPTLAQETPVSNGAPLPSSFSSALQSSNPSLGSGLGVGGGGGGGAQLSRLHTQSPAPIGGRAQISARTFPPPETIKGGLDGHPVSIPGCQGCVRVGPVVKIPVFIRRSNDFSPPSDLSRPMIMVGPGTGVSPFIGFLEQRRCERKCISAGGTCLGWWRGLAVGTVEQEDGPLDGQSPKFTKQLSRSSPSSSPSASSTSPTLVSQRDPRLEAIDRIIRNTRSNVFLPPNGARAQTTSTSPSQINILSGGPKRQKIQREFYADDELDVDQEVEAEDEEEAQKVGDLVLFFGCRDRNIDYLYKRELENFQNEGSLTRLFTAFSRASPPSAPPPVGSVDVTGKPLLGALVNARANNGHMGNGVDQLAASSVQGKMYVQHKMLENADYVRHLILDKNAYFFICGDGMSMARDVKETLIDILAGKGGTENTGKEFMNKAEARKFVQEMIREKQLVQDIWS